MAGEINFGILDTNAPARIAGSFQAGQDEARRNKLAQLTMQQQEQAFADDQVTRQAYKDSAGDQNKLYSLLNSSGNYKAANDVQKQIQDQQKGKIDNAVNALKLVKHHASTVFANPTMDSAMLALQQLQQSTGQDQSAEIARLQATGGDPEMIRKWAAGHAMEADKLLPKFEQFSNGAAQVQGVVDPLTGKFTQNGAFKMQNSPDALLTDSRVRSEGAANRGVTMRGQNLADARGREGNAITMMKLDAKNNPAGQPAKPMPAAALKMQQEDLDAIGTNSGINADLGAVVKQIKDGKINLGPVNNVWNATKNYIGSSDEESRNLNSFKATLEKMRNDSLRLNKGVQTEGDAVRAWNEILSSINDPELVTQRLEEVQKINDRAVNIRKMNVENIRNNYNQPSLDTTGYETQPAALNGGGSGYQDAEKEARYQAWKAKQGAK